MPTTIGDSTCRVDAWSAPSLLIETESYSGEPVSSGTGFVVKHDDHSFLVTAEHVLSGRHPESGVSLNRQEPERVRILHHDALAGTGIGRWVRTDEALRTERGDPRWSVHPQKTVKSAEQPTVFDIDVAVLPLRDLDRSVRMYPIDYRATPCRLAPGFPVSVVGFPFGQGGPAALFPIWKTGHVASDVYWSEGARSFLVDVTGRGGMSGAPVFARQWAPSEQGWDVQTSFVGVYSGRTREESEIGIVWRAELVAAIVDQAIASMPRDAATVE